MPSQVLELALKRSIFICFHGIIFRFSWALWSNTANNSLGSSSSNDAVCKKEHISKVVFLCDCLLIDSYDLIIVSFFNYNSRRFNNQTVSWDTISGAQEDNVSNNKIPDTLSLSGSELTPDHSNVLLLDERLKFNKSLIFGKISCWRSKDNEKSGNNDCNTLLKSFPSVSESTTDTGKESSGCNNPPDLIV